MSHIVMTSIPRSAGSSPDMSIFATRARFSPTGTNSSPASSRKRTPSAAAAPAPKSLVALPPSPTIIFLQPRPAAWAMSWPTP